MSLNAMPKVTHDFKEPLHEDPLPKKIEAANDEEVVFNTLAPSIEAANDNEEMYVTPSSAIEMANDNAVMAPGEEERLRSVMERLGMTHNEDELVVIEEELSVPEGEELFTAESAAEKEAGHSEEGIQSVVLPIDAGGAVRKKGHGGAGAINSGSAANKKKGGLLWKFVKGFFKWTGIAIGAVIALYMTAINKLTDRGVAFAEGKGGHAPAKKAAAHGGGGGHH